MAKAPSGRGGTAKIRFIMLDAEIPEGHLDQLTQAIQSALKPNAMAPQLTTPLPHKVINSASPPSTPIDEALHDDVMDASEAWAATLQAGRARRVHKSTPPKVIDLDLTSDLSWESYANEKSPKIDTDKFLAVAAWFKECRALDEVTVNHVYTCF